MMRAAPLEAIKRAVARHCSRGQDEALRELAGEVAVIADAETVRWRQVLGTIHGQGHVDDEPPRAHQSDDVQPPDVKQTAPPDRARSGGSQ